MACFPKLLVLLGLLAACSGPVLKEQQGVLACDPQLEGAELFAEAGLEGVMVIILDGAACVRSTDAEFAQTAFRPQSTFKIPNAMLGLELGVISAQQQWRWDGEPRALKSWEQDLDLGGALRVSCVPCFQELARGIGVERMQAFLDAVGYGNRDISGPVDAFWLDGGPLRITPVGQAEFVLASLRGELPIAAGHVALVWRLLELDGDGTQRLFGKTGLGELDGRAIGWLVGYVQRGERRYAYATFVRSRAGTEVEAEQRRLMPLRLELTRALLARAQLWVESE
ncbi:MAG: penicillin-binding transpeptidase domain-containing protein [Myxococcota bacterium]|nr:penicillin-binding transpeptidase domain-containing protein [Myxococcota bacterium]